MKTIFFFSLRKVFILKDILCIYAVRHYVKKREVFLNLFALELFVKSSLKNGYKSEKVQPKQKKYLTT